MDVLADEPQETRGIGEFFFSWTQWECVGCTQSTCFFFFFSICYSCLVFLSFSKELRDGPNQNQSYLTISLLYFYLLEFYFNVRRCSEEKNQDVWWTTMSDYLGGLFSFMSFIDCHIHFFTRVDHGSCCTAMAKKTFEHVILNNYVQTSSPRLSFREGRIVKLWKPCKGPHSFNSSFNSTSSAYFLTILKQSHLWHLPLYWTSYNMIWEFLNTGLCKYFKYLNFDNGTWTWTT